VAELAPTLRTDVSSLPPGGAVSPWGGPAAKRSPSREHSLVYNRAFYATSTSGFELRNGLLKGWTRLAQLMEKI
jgi:hypothetical protein